ncbi:MAG: SMI1/KNR4 family protein [Vicinamibacteria bacterium]
MIWEKYWPETLRRAIQRAMDRRKRIVAETGGDNYYTSAVPSDFWKRGWGGNDGASEELIQINEARLGVVLPPSYRTFLQVSNGWWGLDWHVPHLLPVEEIDWFRKNYQDWITAFVEPWQEAGSPPVPDEEYFEYGPKQQPAAMRVEYMADALAVSADFDGAIVLLNPRITFPGDEWEAWLFASWFPGATRYRSFRDLVQRCIEHPR